MSRQPITTSMVDQMKELRAQGIGNTEIARRLHVGHATVNYHIGKQPFPKQINPYKKNSRKLTPNQIEDMKTYKELGLSNKQIALEMGISYETVHRYLGNQQKGSRSDYGSIVSHATGDHFQMNKEPEDKKEEAPMNATVGNALKLVSNTVKFEGRQAKYEIDLHNLVRITLPDLMSPGDILYIIDELRELSTFLKLNECLTVKE